ncbi:Gfo/Idh/MocA family protein [Paenibacillus eucommiae]|uniref:Dehydrogenase n=1 Tax=Paenibacillus eucommiae TaxID=1355755 RepID=A0ABS4IXK4_9BACL|nr:Gfo/Idh/MocA family oxidoreductase [Paenibacillus eucommiae]MBP1992298.1 putative dehydrogenase [Paenibacillus eucommiae]
MVIVKAALIGINGFGRRHLDQMFQLQDQGIVELIAVSEVRLSLQDRQLLEGKGIKCYADYKEMLSSERELDFITLATPIHLHAEMGIEIMESGFHVLLEKPPAVTIQDVDRMIHASRQTGKHCAVNFQLVSGKAFMELKQMITSGALGRIGTITGTGLFQRLNEYYHRTPWAGKNKVGETYILDGTINNPLSHLLNNMLVLSGLQAAETVQEIVPVQVTGELYHANDIEGEDTSCIRAHMSNGVELYFYATLCGAEETTPTIRVEGTLGTAVWSYDNTLTIEKDEELDANHFGEEDSLENMYLNLIHVIRGEQYSLLCPVASTRNFVLISNGAFESSGEIFNIPSNAVLNVPKDDSVATIIKDIAEIIQSASDDKLLFSESGVQWAVGTRAMKMSKYEKFPAYFDFAKEVSKVRQ